MKIYIEYTYILFTHTHIQLLFTLFALLNTYKYIYLIFKQFTANLIAFINFFCCFCNSIIFIIFVISVCGQPAVPLNAKVQTISGDAGIIEAKYDCDSGYELFGPKSIKCDQRTGWERELPFCGTNVAYRKPVNQSSYTRAGPANYANDGKPGNKVKVK